MKIYSFYGHKDFIICCGYKGYLIKEYFANYFLHSSDVTIDIKKNKINVHQNKGEDWKVTLVNTGEETLTGGRILRIKKFIDGDFLMTYGDGVANVDINKLINAHKKNKKLATITVVTPQIRFGMVNISKENIVKNFIEKPKTNSSLINGGFFVFKKEIFKYLKDDFTIWEKEPLEKLSKNRELVSFHHKGFWYAMDTLREKNYLESLWTDGKAPWKIWND